MNRFEIREELEKRLAELQDALNRFDNEYDVACVEVSNLAYNLLILKKEMEKAE